jgi:hypothetical protein
MVLGAARPHPKKFPQLNMVVPMTIERVKIK